MCCQSSWENGGVHWLVRGQDSRSFSCLARTRQPLRAGAQATHGACWKLSKTTCGGNMGTLTTSSLPGREDLYFWELTYLHCPPGAFLSLLPQNSYQGVSFHPLAIAVLANPLWWHLCCVFGPKCSSAIHKLNHKTLQHHSSYREEANGHGYAHTSTCRVDITKHINTFLMMYSVYKNIASKWTRSIWNQFLLTLCKLNGSQDKPICFNPQD